jgi:hypothetical protein
METEWYGWQTLIADGASLIMIPIMAGVTESEELGYVALGGYFLAPPVIHAANGRWGIGFASLGFRTGLPLVGLLVGAAADDDRNDFVPAGAIIGFVVGVLGAVALDASWLAFKKVDVNEDISSARPTKRSAFSFTPTVAPRKEGGWTMGLGGTF